MCALTLMHVLLHISLFVCYTIELLILTQYYFSATSNAFRQLFSSKAYSNMCFEVQKSKIIFSYLFLVLSTIIYMQLMAMVRILILWYIGIIKYYLIVGIDKDMYGFPKCRKASCLYNFIRCKKLAVKLHWSNMLSQVKKLFKNSIQLRISYKLCYQNFIKPCTTRFSSVSLTALQPYVRPTSHRYMGPFFLTMQVIAV